MRPEALRIEVGGVMVATVVEKVYLGQSIQYGMETAIGRLQVVEQNPHHLYGLGDPVALAIDAADVVLLER
jgi:ABC-type Fe3+/spermidine/putrescine transport system ATPase subunit